ncbi:putative peptidyl-tRNA hydrolase PTRHD1 [Aplysia californica]|uniref:peptidyl-tRNA hydrolase n=1 Tax=Aplysia californica TaxID=6500 RepID=A0ABM0JWP7_APLCA|nr:putative peptidyl-tRNA hydrolase PTRHD1 [Aplysia californica]
MAASPIVQYVVIRSDLVSKLKWPTGALIAQACHACTAVTHLYYKDEATQEYLADLDRMHKIILEAKDEESLSKLAETLTTENISHKLWVEQPENFPTCLAVKPYRKEEVQKFFKPFKLFK